MCEDSLMNHPSAPLASVFVVGFSRCPGLAQARQAGQTQWKPTKKKNYKSFIKKPKNLGFREGSDRNPAERGQHSQVSEQRKSRREKRHSRPF